MNEKPNGLNRRSTIKGAAAAAITLSAPAIAVPTAKRPNFLFIMADDLGYADLSCYGRRDYKTPNIDALAARGMRLTDAYANSAVCTATRVGLITGRYQYRLPVGLEEPLGLRPIGLPPAHPTITSLLKKVGYATSLIGKWHMGYLPNYGPRQSGYDEFWGLRGGGVDYFTHKIGGRADLWDGDTPVEKVGYLTDLLGERAIESIKRNAGGDKPWLMSLHFTAPHWPWETPNDRAESERLDKLNGPLVLLHTDGGSMAIYAQMVKRLDYQIGRIVAALKASGQLANTVIVFTSDNGGERFSDTWPFSGKKSELLEGGIRVPAIVVWPGVTRAGSVSDEQCMSMDWLPTFVAAAGGAPDPRFPLDGIDIRQALAGGKLPERDLFWRYKNHKQEAMRRGRWKYLKIDDNSFLFDVVADPLERGNLKARHPEMFNALQRAWAEWNKGMLPLDPQSMTHGPSANEMADHIDTKVH